MSSEKEKPFAVVEFFDGISLVPVGWLSEDTKNCSYPPISNQLKINKMISNQQDPDISWREHNVKRLFCYAETYERGVAKMKLAMEMSDIESENENLKSAKRIRRRKIVDSDSEIDLDENLPSLPKLPSDFTSLMTPRETLSETRSEYSPASSISRSNLASIQENRIPKNDEFCNLVLTKLNTVIRKLNCLESSMELNRSEGSTEVVESLDEIYTFFPVKSLEDLKNINDKLQVDEVLRKKTVSALKLIGGTDVHNTTVGVLKKVFTNKVGSECSLKGKKKKEAFLKYSYMYQVIIDSVRLNFPGTTELEIQKVIALWLTQCTLRLSREKSLD